MSVTLDSKYIGIRKVKVNYDWIETKTYNLIREEKSDISRILEQFDQQHILYLSTFFIVCTIMLIKY